MASLVDQIKQLSQEDKDQLTEALGIEYVGSDLDRTWVLIGGILVLFMQTGFATLEGGSIRAKNISNIMFKNIMDMCMGVIIFWLVGYGFAYGSGGGFIGTDKFALSHIGPDNPVAAEEYGTFFFQFAFAATAATIISGAVAERCSLEVFFVYSACITGFVYPVVAHWIWSDYGWISAFSAQRFPCGDTSCNGLIDFAGSGVVHMTGGFAAMTAAWMIGPRVGRFTVGPNGEHEVNEITGHSQVLVTIGTMILLFGWYGFNCGSTLGMSGGLSILANKVAVNTTLAACTGGLSVAILRKTTGSRVWDVPEICNGILAGLVGITAGCATVEPWGAALIGIIAAFIYIGSVHVMNYYLKIDDPLNASSIHGACGAWGLLAVAIFSSSEGIAFAGYNEKTNMGVQFGTQVVGLIAIAAWSIVMPLLIFVVCSAFMELTVSEEIQKQGLDLHEHGGGGYQMVEMTKRGTLKHARSVVGLVGMVPEEVNHTPPTSSTKEVDLEANDTTNIFARKSPSKKPDN